MSYDDDNIFAKILRGEAPAHVVDEDDVSLTFMDLMPQSEGHTLIIPKESAEDILHVSTEALGHVIRQTQRVAKAVDQAFHPDGVMIAQLNRAPAGQTVFHLHFHVIPRWSGEAMPFMAREMADPKNLKENAEKIRKYLINIV